MKKILIIGLLIGILVICGCEVIKEKRCFTQLNCEFIEISVVNSCNEQAQNDTEWEKYCILESIGQYYECLCNNRMIIKNNELLGKTECKE